MDVLKRLYLLANTINLWKNRTIRCLPPPDMQITIEHQGHAYEADLSKPLDLSIPLEEGLETVNCFYAPLMEATPVIAGDFIGSTAQGGPVNFLNVRFNPHGNGTHTECVGHIAKERYTINKTLKKFHYLATLVSVYPRKLVNGDRVISKDLLEALFTKGSTPALVIRTLPNDDLKLKTNYSGSNPPYIDAEAMQYLVDCGVEHLLLDLPSVDREEDGGKLTAHKVFWNFSGFRRTNCTITELVYVDNAIKDGLYLLNLQIASFEIDASPSKPVFYELNKRTNNR